VGQGTLARPASEARPWLTVPQEAQEREASGLSAYEISIYRAVLRQYESSDPGSLNVSARTYPLDAACPRIGLADSECLKGIPLENLAGLAHSFHDLTPEVLPAKNIKLVDPKQQSKIVRDNDPDKTIRDGKSVHTAVEGGFCRCTVLDVGNRLR
jgi:hypothetical protein